MFNVVLVAAVLVACHLGRGGARSSDAPFRVDRFELNHYFWAEGCQSHQVILWRWSPEEVRYVAERYYFVDADGSQDPFPVAGKRWRFIHRDVWGRRPDRIFEAAECLESYTDYDPVKEPRNAANGRR